MNDSSDRIIYKKRTSFVEFLRVIYLLNNSGKDGTNDLSCKCKYLNKDKKWGESYIKCDSCSERSSRNENLLGVKEIFNNDDRTTSSSSSNIQRSNDARNDNDPIRKLITYITKVRHKRFGSEEIPVVINELLERKKWETNDHLCFKLLVLANFIDSELFDPKIIVKLYKKGNVENKNNDDDEFLIDKTKAEVKIFCSILLPHSLKRRCVGQRGERIYYESSNRMNGGVVYGNLDLIEDLGGNDDVSKINFPRIEKFSEKMEEEFSENKKSEKKIAKKSEKKSRKKNKTVVYI